MKENNSAFSVALQLSAIPIIFVVILGYIYFFTSNTLNDHKEMYVNLEYAGRQRMLQEQHLSQTLLASLGNPNAAALTKTQDILSEANQSLIKGGEVIARLGFEDKRTIQPVRSATATQLLVNQRQDLEASFKLSDQLIKISPESPGFSAKLSELIDLDRRLQESHTDVAKSITEGMEARSQSLINDQGLISTVAALIALLISWWIGTRITRPLQLLVNTANQVASGDLRVDALKLSQSREIQNLGYAFNNMVVSLRSLTQQIHEVTGFVNSAAAEILASTQQQASSTKEQAATVQEISTTMQEISQSGAEISEKAKQVAASAEATSTASEMGVSAVESTSRVMSDVRQQIEEVAIKIVSLSERTQAVGDIVHTVNEISEQSNLLALNASIEAASAGEHGSRFGVVAGEMRNLAQRAKESTVQVSSILGEIQRGINSTVMLTEEAVKRSENGKMQAHVTQNTIQQMTQTTIESVHAFQQIIGASSQQQIGFEQVAQGMRDIRQVTEQTAIGTSQLEKALANLNDLSIQLRTAVSRYQL